MKRQDLDILILIVVIVGYILHAGRIWLMNRHLRTNPLLIPILISITRNKGMIDRGQDGPEPGPTKYKSSIGHITNNRLILICGVKTMSLIRILLLFWSPLARMGTLKEGCQTEFILDNLVELHWIGYLIWMYNSLKPQEWTGSFCTKCRSIYWTKLSKWIIWS